MNWFMAIIVYLLIWWTLIFCFLPYGNKAEDINSNGNAPSAPQNPRIKQKFIITSLAAFVLWLLLFTGFQTGFLSWDKLAQQFNKEWEQVQ